MQFYSSDNCYAMAPQKVIFPKVRKILLRMRYYKVKMIFCMEYWVSNFMLHSFANVYRKLWTSLLTMKLQIQNLLLKWTTLDTWKLFLYILPGIFLALFLEFAMFVKLAILDFQNGRRSSVKGNDPIFWWL